MPCLVAAVLPLLVLAARISPVGSLQPCEGAVEWETHPHCFTRVVVVGAGLSGLAAARTLEDNWQNRLMHFPSPPLTESLLLTFTQDEHTRKRLSDCCTRDICSGASSEQVLGGLKLTVLEARDRIGGRVNTVYEPSGGAIELGAGECVASCSVCLRRINALFAPKGGSRPAPDQDLSSSSPSLRACRRRTAYPAWTLQTARPICAGFPPWLPESAHQPRLQPPLEPVPQIRGGVVANQYLAAKSPLMPAVL
eukprot:SAG31_NODE_194_length_20722_cov_19.854192_17_plen_252_part_00